MKLIDIHSHILPAVDDGARDWEMTERMLRMAVSQGIGRIVATPHFIEGDEGHSPRAIEEAFRRTCERIAEMDLDLELELGSEVFLDSRVPERIRSGVCHTLGKSDCILLELPSYLRTDTLDRQICDLEMEGYRIVLAHVERYPLFQEAPELIEEYAGRGVMMQLNAASLLSKDRRLNRRSWQMVESGWIHVVASDAHSDGHRRFRMQEVYRALENRIGIKTARRLCIENPALILANETIDTRTLRFESARKTRVRLRPVWERLIP